MRKSRIREEPEGNGAWDAHWGPVWGPNHQNAGRHCCPSLALGPRAPRSTQPDSSCLDLRGALDSDPSVQRKGVCPKLGEGSANESAQRSTCQTTNALLNPQANDGPLHMMSTNKLHQPSSQYILSFSCQPVGDKQHSNKLLSTWVVRGTQTVALLSVHVWSGLANPHTTVDAERKPELKCARASGIGQTRSVALGMSPDSW